MVPYPLKWNAECTLGSRINNYKENKVAKKDQNTNGKGTTCHLAI